MSVKSVVYGGLYTAHASDDGLSADYYSTIGLAQGGGANPYEIAGPVGTIAYRTDVGGGYRWAIGRIRWSLSSITQPVSSAYVLMNCSSVFSDPGGAPYAAGLLVKAGTGWSSGVPDWVAFGAADTWGTKEITGTGPVQFDLNSTGLAALNAAIVAGDPSFDIAIMSDRATLSDLDQENVGFDPSSSYNQLVVSIDDHAIMFGTDF